jgi:hypothetical protein
VRSAVIFPPTEHRAQDAGPLHLNFGSGGGIPSDGGSSPGAVLGWQEVTMSHARPITTQKEWDSRHQREQQRQRRSEIISRMTLVFSVLAIITAFYFVTMVP